MTLSFDDLIPQQGQQQPAPLTQQAPALAKGGGLSFDDLIPGSKPKLPSASELEGLDSDQKVNDFLKGLPEQHQETARNAWADAFVAKQRKDGYFGKPLADTVSRIARSVPGVGSYLDEADAGLQSAMGNDYSNALAYRRAQDRAIDNTETEKLGTLPVIGDVYRSGIEKAGGTIAGAFALPWARVSEGAGFIPGAINAGANTAAYEAAGGFGRGEGGFEKRAAQAANDVVNSAPTAMMFGGALGKLQRQVEPPSAAQQNFLRAAEEENVTVPKFISSESPLVRGVAGYSSSQPLTGTIVRGAANRAADSLGEAADRVSETASNRGIGAAAAAPDATAAAQTSGEMVRGAIRDWVTGKSGPTSGGVLGRLYDAVDNAMMPYARSASTGAPPPGSTLTQLTATGRLANTLMSQDARAGTTVNQRAVSHVMDALTQPNGMTYAGIKDLRTYVGQLLDGSIVPEAGTPMPAIKRLYGALTQDLRTSVQQQSSSPDALKLFDRANAAAARVNDIRESLAKIIGKEGDVTPERLVDSLITKASSKSGADISQLLLAKKYAGNEAWSELSSAVIQRMGRGQGPNPGSPGAADVFSPDRFLTYYGKQLSENGKVALFGSASDPLRRSLDNIATISERFRDLRQYQNPSGTGQAVGYTALGGMALANPLLALSKLAGDTGISYLLSRPSGARAASNWSTALWNVSQGNVSQAALKIATMSLAKQIAEQTGQSENDIASGLYKAAGAQ